MFYNIKSKQADCENKPALLWILETSFWTEDYNTISFVAATEKGTGICDTCIFLLLLIPRLNKSQYFYFSVMRLKSPSSATHGPTSSSWAWPSAPPRWTCRASWQLWLVTCRLQSPRRSCRPSGFARWRRPSAKSRSLSGPRPRCRSTPTSLRTSRSSRSLLQVRTDFGHNNNKARIKWFNFKLTHDNYLEKNQKLNKPKSYSF